MSVPREQVHGNCVAVGEAGILMRGKSGAGKSDLTLRLIEGGGQLVADDRVDLVREGDVIYASSPAALSGLMEVRGLGILPFDYCQRVRLRAVIELQAVEPADRLPEQSVTEVMGLNLPCFQIDPGSLSAVIKVTLVSALVTGSIERTDD